MSLLMERVPAAPGLYAGPEVSGFDLYVESEIFGLDESGWVACVAPAILATGLCFGSEQG